MENQIKLCPPNYKTSIRPTNKKNVLTPSSNKKNILTSSSDKIIPKYLFNKWDLLNTIITYTSITFDDLISDFELPDEENMVEFSSNEIKEFYNEYNYPSFEKIYGMNGLKHTLYYRNGICHNTADDIWVIYPKPFLHYLRIEYNNDCKEYCYKF